jgi:NADPH-dependent 2,4-dienoyl-CoA reductase/sulfur reductase-like enzyme/rhodanese-related sulfurtransferase
MDKQNKIVIIGGVACGPKAAARARRRDPNAEIILVDRGDHLSYAGCGLPYYVGGSVAEIENLQKTSFNLIRNEEYFKNVKNIDARIRTNAEQLNREEKSIVLRNLDTNESEQVLYDKLVLATGSSSVVPPILGIDKNGVFVLQNLQDAMEIRKRIDSGEVDHVVVIGAGLIGVEIVESFFNHAVDVVVVEREKQILPSILDPEIAKYVQKELSRDGVEFMTNQSVMAIEGKGKAEKVIVKGKEIATDMVIVSAGVRPNTKLARQAGLEIGKTGAICINEYMQTSDPDIYAGGDCVECHDLVSGNKIYTPMGTIANRHGRIIGNNVTGDDDTFPGIVGTVIVKALNINIAKTGLTEDYARKIGMDVETSITPCQNHVHFYPGNKFFLIKMTADRKSGRLLGAQLAGPGDVAKRVDVLAAAIQFGATLKQTANLDLSYSPPFSHALDGLTHAANNTRNRIDDIARAISAEKTIACIKKGENPLILLDLREEQEVENNPITIGSVINIPLSSFRRRIDEVPRDVDIVCCCTQGVRSYEAMLILKGEGFDRVSYIDGGMKMLY